MKRFLIATALAVLAGSALAAADIGVSVNIGQPGFYGRIDIGNVPQPQVIYAAPVIIQQAPIGIVRQPIYLHVPPGHEKKWDKHCRKYNACGQPVYFVQENWYTNVYAPGRRGDRDDRDEGHKGKGKGKDKDKGKHKRGHNDD